MSDVDIRHLLVAEFESKGERYTHYNFDEMEQYIIACALKRYYRRCSKVIEDFNI